MKEQTLLNILNKCFNNDMPITPKGSVIYILTSHKNNGEIRYKLSNSLQHAINMFRSNDKINTQDLVLCRAIVPQDMKLEIVELKAVGAYMEEFEALRIRQYKNDTLIKQEYLNDVNLFYDYKRSLKRLGRSLVSQNSGRFEMIKDNEKVEITLMKGVKNDNESFTL